MMEVVIGINAKVKDRCKVVNDRTGTDESANYVVRDSDDGHVIGYIRGHDRREGPWALARKVAELMERKRKAEALLAVFQSGTLECNRLQGDDA